MKIHILLLFIIIVPISMLGQNPSFDFQFNYEGLSPNNYVIETDSLSKEDLFNRTINWIKETYVNPNVVIKATIENEMVRITGVKQSYLLEKALGMKMYRDVRYTLTFEFKPGKYRAILGDFEVSYPATSWQTANPLPKDYFNKKNQLKNQVESYKDQIPELLNSILSDHFQYISAGPTGNKDDW